ncbi:MAG: adenylosuccinate lyase [Parcubacteria group bacterium Gr01-1014_72]|nr:MAG: adenylosuccinate lyase [Parcubacteria group bacterium Gr01-1014_72]
MIGRYEDKEIEEIWSTEHKLRQWQNVELKTLEARANAGEVEQEAVTEISERLRASPIDLAWFNEEERRVGHDYNAFIAERRRYLPENLARFFHEKLTSYDGEEYPFAVRIHLSCRMIRHKIQALHGALWRGINAYRFVPMMERTHGRLAEIQSLGRCFITWCQPLRNGLEHLEYAENELKWSKLSGAIGTNSGLSFALEQKALGLLGAKQYIGATQIMPRILYSPIANALADIATWLEKIAFDLWLGSRDPYPRWEEPFAESQKGSSAMPHKKNPITLEKVRGMARCARAYAHAIQENIATPEGRDISQSSVERIAWPDIFHTLCHMLDCVRKVIDGLVVYPDNLAREIIESRGTYASSKAKDLLAEWLTGTITVEEVYRIIQLAAFNAFQPGETDRDCRLAKLESVTDADYLVYNIAQAPFKEPISIKDIIMTGTLKLAPSIAMDNEKKLEINRWNIALKTLFSDPDRCEKWRSIFEPSYWLEAAEPQFKAVLRT